MTTKLCARLSYDLMLSIALVMTGFLGVGIRAFASARISSSIYLGALCVVLVAIPLYFARRRLLASSARITRRSSAAWLVQVRPQVVPVQSNRRRSLVQGQECAPVVFERRSKQLAGSRVVDLTDIASETLHG